ncbi:hypothetical protein AB6A40_005172 [Gnathostoma spinigerum]|uniref:Uncharacterized protein n=1 Tax=Gnathostoma spinigerum TaxID=75299 RepID=A0ABD6ENB2_9BILA
MKSHKLRMDALCELLSQKFRQLHDVDFFETLIEGYENLTHKDHLGLAKVDLLLNQELQDRVAVMITAAVEELKERRQLQEKQKALRMSMMELVTCIDYVCAKHKEIKSRLESNTFRAEKFESDLKGKILKQFTSSSDIETAVDKHSYATTIETKLKILSNGSDQKMCYSMGRRSLLFDDQGMVEKRTAKRSYSFTENSVHVNEKSDRKQRAKACVRFLDDMGNEKQFEGRPSVALSSDRSHLLVSLDGSYTTDSTEGKGDTDVAARPVLLNFDDDVDEPTEAQLAGHVYSLKKGSQNSITNRNADKEGKKSEQRGNGALLVSDEDLFTLPKRPVMQSDAMIKYMENVSKEYEKDGRACALSAFQFDRCVRSFFLQVK